jgi:hypothetical protein
VRCRALVEFIECSHDLLGTLMEKRRKTLYGKRLRIVEKNGFNGG